MLTYTMSEIAHVRGWQKNKMISSSQRISRTTHPTTLETGTTLHTSLTLTNSLPNHRRQPLPHPLPVLRVARPLARLRGVELRAEVAVRAECGWGVGGGEDLDDAG